MCTDRLLLIIITCSRVLCMDSIFILNSYGLYELLGNISGNVIGLFIICKLF